MNFETKKHDNALLVCMQGRLDAASSGLVSTRFNEYAAMPEPLVILDLKDVDFIDSSGLGLMVSLYRKRKEASADVVLCNLSAQARSLFELTRMHRVFTIHETQEAAIRAAS